MTNPSDKRSRMVYLPLLAVMLVLVAFLVWQEVLKTEEAPARYIPVQLPEHAEQDEELVRTINQLEFAFARATRTVIAGEHEFNLHASVDLLKPELDDASTISEAVKIVSLEKLSLEYGSGSIPLDHAKLVASASNLESFAVQTEKLAPDVAEALAWASSLRELWIDVSGSTLTEEQFAPLKALENLRIIWLKGNIDGAILDHLTAFKNAEQIVIKSPLLVDEDIAHLEKLAKPEHAKLKLTLVSDTLDYNVVSEFNALHPETFELQLVATDEIFGFFE